MGRFYLFLLLMQLINASKAELALQISKTVDGIETPVVNGQLHEIAGTNLTLTCKVVQKYYWNHHWFDDNVFWGWRRGNVQFNNVADLKKLADDNHVKLQQFQRFYPSEPLKHFHPLFPQDSGTYFCKSFDTNLFKIVQLSVSVKMDPDSLNRYVQALNKSQAEFDLSSGKQLVSFPKFLCSDNMFMCNSRKFCVDYKFVCDGISDCNDGSDEDADLCGYSPCRGRKQCFNRRCCCDKNQDLKCVSNADTSCCAGVDGRHFKNLHVRSPHHFEAVRYGTSDFDIMYRSTAAWGTISIIVFSIIIILMVIFGIIFRRHLLEAAGKIRTRLRNTANNAPPSASASVPTISVDTPNVSAMEGATGESQAEGSQARESRLLPASAADNLNQRRLPSYDEAIANTQPSASFLEKVTA